MNTGRRPKTPGSETKQLITYITYYLYLHITYVYICNNSPFPTSLKGLCRVA